MLQFFFSQYAHYKQSVLGSVLKDERGLENQRELRSIEAELIRSQVYNGEVTEGVVNYWLVMAYAAHLGKSFISDQVEMLRERIRNEHEHGGTGEIPKLEQGG